MELIGNKQFKRWIYLLSFIIPFCYPFRYLISSVSHIHVYIVMYSAIWLLMISFMIKTKHLIVSKWLLMVFAYYILTLALSPDHSTGMKWIINLMTGIIIAGVLNSYGTNKDFRFLIPFVIACLICSTLFLPSVVRHLPINLTYNYTVRIPYMEGDISVGPNGWATTLALAFMITVCTIIFKNLQTLFGVAILLIIGYFMYLTQSRTQTFSILIVLGLLIFTNIFNKRKRWYTRIASLLIIIISIVLFIWIVKDGLLGNSRLGELNLNGRNSIWQLSADAFFNRMNLFQKFFGVGTGGTSVYLFNVAGSDFAYASSDHISAHTIYLDSLISSGLIGTVLAIGYWVRACYILLFRGKKSVNFIFPLYVLISGIGAHVFLSWEYGFLIAFTEVGIYNCRNQTKQFVRLNYNGE